jgi:hypothetical protein
MREDRKGDERILLKRMLGKHVVRKVGIELRAVGLSPGLQKLNPRAKLDTRANNTVNNKMRNIGMERDSLAPWYMVWLTNRHGPSLAALPHFINSAGMITGTAM